MGGQGGTKGTHPGGAGRGYSRTVSPILRVLLPRSSSASTLFSKVRAATRKKKSRTFSPAPWEETSLSVP